MKESKRKCSKCGASPSENPAINLHRFPKPEVTNSLRCELWAKYCFPEHSWHSREFQTKLYSEHRMLCTKHFKETYFVDTAGKRLFKSAVPNEECDKVREMLTNPDNVVDVPLPSNTIEPVAGPSQPLLENMNVLNFNQATDVIQDNSNKCIESVTPPVNIMSSELKIKDSNIENQAIITQCKKHLKRVNILQERIKKMKNKSFINEIAKNSSINAVLKSKISPTAALLLQGEIRNYKKAAKARRWDTDNKIVALRLFKRSPTSYRLLRRMICLPAPSTLKSLLNKFNMGVGLNTQIFNILKKKALQNKIPSDNEYVLMWDEMSIKKHLQYNKKEDIIEGFQDHASHGRSPEIASYALVFMVAGIRKFVKQPIAFYLSAGSVTADRLVVIIKEVLNHCFRAGLQISATVCDLDGVNKKSVVKLGATVEQPYVTIDNQEVVTLFDTPHLLKCFRNLFLKYDIECPMFISSGIGVAKWSHIKDFYELDNNNPNFVFAPCLKQEHLNPNTKQKMRVKLAAQVLSHSVAAGMYAKIAQGELSTSATTTANVIAKMDKLFDCVNAYTPDRRRGKPFATNFKRNSPHMEHFRHMKEFFTKLKFLGCRRAPPSQEGWVWTLNGLERVWRNLTNKHKDIKSLATRRLQQDPLENLFGCIRSNCGANSNPTVGQFVAGLKTAVLSNLPHIVAGNCEKDENEAIISNYKTLLEPATDICIDTDKIEIEIQHKLEYSYEDRMKGHDSSEIQACAYVCGFIIKNNPNKLCQFCKTILISETQLAEHMFVEFKEYDDEKKTLMYATKNLISCVEKSATIINKYLENEAFKKELKENIFQILKVSVDFSFLSNCKAHKECNVIYILKSVFFICVKRFCILKNRHIAEESSKAALRRKMNILQHK